MDDYNTLFYGYWKEIEYPKMFLGLAEELSLTRSKISANIYNKKTDKHRGEDEHTISHLGVWAELVARHIFEEQDLEYDATSIIDTKPVVEADIFLSNIVDGFDSFNLISIDVKGVKSKERYLRVNYNAHNNPKKKITEYLFIQPRGSRKARYCWFSHIEVNEWEVVDSKYTKCYRKKII